MSTPKLRFTTVHINAVVAMVALVFVVGILASAGEYCAAGTIGAVIGTVAITFAKMPDPDGN